MKRSQNKQNNIEVLTLNDGRLRTLTVANSFISSVKSTARNTSYLILISDNTLRRSWPILFLI
jgi:hypothetical protein